MRTQLSSVVFVEAFAGLLAEVASRAGGEFSGIGLIICDSPEHLPILPLRDSAPPLATSNELGVFLAAISQQASPYHDGFHVLSSALNPLAIAQYFSPPIVPGIALNRSRRFGGRYVAALFGSVLPSVRATGISSRDFGIAIFEQGHEIWFEPTR
jgi:hypothetical protein